MKRTSSTRHVIASIFFGDSNSAFRTSFRCCMHHLFREFVHIFHSRHERAKPCWFSLLSITSLSRVGYTPAQVAGACGRCLQRKQNSRPQKEQLTATVQSFKISMIPGQFDSLGQKQTFELLEQYESTNCDK